MTSLERVLADYTASSLLATIREKPAEDVPRLMFADRIQELGGDELELWAEFIRSQIELSNWPCSAFMYSCHENGFEECQCGDANRLALARRASDITLFINAIFHETIEDYNVFFESRRGFPFKARGKLSQLHNDGFQDKPGMVGCLHKVVELWPIEYVDVLDKRPLLTNGRYYWSSGVGQQTGSHVLPTSVIHSVTTIETTYVFNSREESLSALSFAMLKLARRMANNRKVTR